MISITQPTQSPYKPLLSALGYRYMGYSVIPIWGDNRPEQSKQSVVNWKEYQTRYATDSELSAWFEGAIQFGVAIITGRISQLMVLDFDDEHLAEQFRQQFPELLQTKIVLSAGRNLPHYYYRLRPHQVVQSRRVAGADLLAEGRYVVAPPTKILEREYRSLGGLPITLTDGQIQRILAFFAEQGAVYQDDKKSSKMHALNDTTSLSAPTGTLTSARLQNIGSSVKGADSAPTGTLSPITPDEAVQLYQQYVVQFGRNESLFRVTLALRDAGWQEESVKRLMSDLHAKTLRPAVKETHLARMREAQKTIASVYTRPARRIPPKHQALPNSLREYFARHNQIGVARLLDALFLVGAPVHRPMTELEICNAVSGLVGRFTVLQVLKLTYQNKEPIFLKVNPAPRPPTPTNVALNGDSVVYKKCLSVGGTQSDKKGRPPVTYRIPTPLLILNKLKIKWSLSDPITCEDVVSSAKYRQAMHRELIKRRPNSYTRDWLARRLNVTPRTCRRYHAQCGVRVKAQYERIYLNWGNMKAIPQQATHAGHFLEDIHGKRYPLMLKVVKQLLAKRLSPCVVKQLPNYYWHENGKCDYLKVMGVADETPKNALKSESFHHDEYLCDYDEKIAKKAKYLTSPEKETIPAKGGVADTYRPKRSRYYQKALPNPLQEGYAQALYRTVNASHIPATQVRLSLARQWVEQYGVELVKSCLRVLSMRQNIRNRAGFAREWLRSEQRLIFLRGA